MRNLLILVILFSSINCGGGGSGDSSSANAPNVAGTYLCDAGCSGTCVFDSTLTVSQSGSSVTVWSPNFPDATGTIDDDGNFTASSANCNCSGLFEVVDGTAFVDCTCDGVECQSARFSLES